MAHWLLKSEPEAYGWDDLVRDGEGVWDGVRNHMAANNLKAMQIGDQAIFYHSVTGKAAVGVMQVSATAFPDPTEPEGTRWVAVKVQPVAPLARPVPLAVIKAEPRLAACAMLKYNRLSVAPLTDAEWAVFMELGGGTI